MAATRADSPIIIKLKEALIEASAEKIIAILGEINKTHDSPTTLKEAIRLVCDKINDPAWNPPEISRIHAMLTAYVLVVPADYPEDLFGPYHKKVVRVLIKSQLKSQAPLQQLLLLHKRYSEDKNQGAIEEIEAALIEYVKSIRDETQMNYLFSSLYDDQTNALQKKLITQFETQLQAEEKSTTVAGRKSHLHRLFCRMRLETTHPNLRLNAAGKAMAIESFKSAIMNCFRKSPLITMDIFESKDNVISRDEKGKMLKQLVKENILTAIEQLIDFLSSKKDEKTRLYLYTKLALLTKHHPGLQAKAIGYLQRQGKDNKEYKEYCDVYLDIIKKSETLFDIEKSNPDVFICDHALNDKMNQHFREKRAETTGTPVAPDAHARPSKRGFWRRGAELHLSELSELTDDADLDIYQTFARPAAPPL